MSIVATFDSSYNASLYEAAGRDPHMLSLAISFISKYYTFDKLEPGHIEWAVKEIRSQQQAGATSEAA